MIKSRLTSKAQTTIPQAVRTALNLQDGDEIQYDLDGDRAILRKAWRAPADDPFSAFDDWDTEADRKAYAGL